MCNDRNNKQQKEILFLLDKKKYSFFYKNTLTCHQVYGKTKKQNDIVEFGSSRDSNGV